MNNFRPGMKVAAIEDFWQFQKGQVLTVASVERGVYEAFDGVAELCLLTFVEVAPSPDFEGFDARFFRPVVERGTDAGMSILRSLLNKADQPAREDA